MLSKSIKRHFYNSICSLHVSVTVWSFLKYCELLHYYYIWYGDLCPVIFDVTAVTEVSQTTSLQAGGGGAG